VRNNLTITPCCDPYSEEQSNYYTLVWPDSEEQSNHYTLV
jgi:hypothetical protein